MSPWNRYLLIMAAASACAATVLEDTLNVQNLSGTDKPIVMVSARTKPGIGGCRKDWVSRLASLQLGNLLSPDGFCNSEVAVFSKNNAMKLEAVDWTDNTGDIRSIAVDAIIDVPITIWIADLAASKRAHDELNNANLLFRQNKVGVQFAPTYSEVTNASGIEQIEAGVDVSSDGDIVCVKSGITALKGSRYYTPGRLNVYYVNKPSREAFTGRNCAILETPACPGTGAEAGDGNITYLGRMVNLATLAHELGHAFGLRPGPCGGHTNGLPGFDGTNIMWAQGLPTRSRFSLGQAFRMNTHTDEWGGSMLIRNQLRVGPPRDCPPLQSTDICPALSTDWPRSLDDFIP